MISVCIQAYIYILLILFLWRALTNWMSSRVKYALILCPKYFLLVFILKELKICFHKDLCTRMFTAALFIISPNECPYSEGWINKMWYVLYGILHSNEMSKISIHVTTWMTLKDIILKKIQTYCGINLFKAQEQAIPGIMTWSRTVMTWEQVWMRRRGMQEIPSELAMNALQLHLGGSSN